MEPQLSPYALASTAAAEIVDRLGEHRVALVLGSGWADATDDLGTVLDELPVHELTGVPRPTVSGHAGVIRSVRFDRADGPPVRVLVLAGRSHLYEGHTVCTAVLSGCGRVILTNAAGSLRTDLAIGDPVVISDQLNLTGANPMVGDHPPEGFPSRFVDLSDLYSASVREHLIARSPSLAEGVYAGLLGGSFETPAEIRMLRTLGADLVGMSTVLEAIAARHLGAAVLGLSLVTNLAAGLQQTIDHLDVLAAAQDATPALRVALSDALSVLGPE